MIPPATLGTLLRQLIELLDGDLEKVYRQSGLDWRPKYTPILRALLHSEPRSIGEIAQAVGVSQPAASQTLREMAVKGHLVIEKGEDGRTREVSLTSHCRAMTAALRTQWRATNAAADDLERELGFPLSEALQRSIAALQTKSFAKRIEEAKSKEPL